MQNTQHGISCLHCVLSVRDERSDIHAMVSACSSLTLTTKPKMTVLVLVTLLAFGSLTLTAQPAAAQEQQENATLPISYPATVLEGDSETCASIEEREMARTQIQQGNVSLPICYRFFLLCLHDNFGFPPLPCLSLAIILYLLATWWISPFP